jgi:hypothetical protein
MSDLRHIHDPVLSSLKKEGTCLLFFVLLFLFFFLLYRISFQQLSSRVYLSIFPNLFLLSIGDDTVCECHS